MNDIPLSDGSQPPPAPVPGGIAPAGPSPVGPNPAPAHKTPFKHPALIVGAVVLLMLLAILALVLALGGKKSSTSVVCADHACLNRHFAECSPATYDYDQSGTTIRYSVKSATDLGCSVKAEYLKAKYLSDAVGKTMTCDFDNSEDFDTAAQNALHFPDDYSCSGDVSYFSKDVGA